MTAADQVKPLVDALLGESPINITLWDGSYLGPESSEQALVVHDVNALKRIAWAPGELGLARAFVTGEIEAKGDVVELVLALSKTQQTNAATMAKSVPSMLKSVKDLGVIGTPPSVPDIEYQPPLLNIHTLKGDASAISHHYDVGNEFYELILGSSMTYSCARFSKPSFDLTAAQDAKHDNICVKLGLPELEAPQLLDVGCGWGSMAIHAAKTYGARVVAITISESQAAKARERVEAAGVSDLVEIRLQDYRELDDEKFDAISSIGMSEHVGSGNLVEYFTLLRNSLRPQGRLLNHAISSIGGSKLSSRTFMYRYIFPGGELIDIGKSLEAMQDAGFEIRDVESLREHYAKTLRSWIDNLEANWDEAVELVGIERARAWRLYMAGSAVGFIDAGINIHQALGVVNDDTGASGMPAQRSV